MTCVLINGAIMVTPVFADTYYISIQLINMMPCNYKVVTTMMVVPSFRHVGLCPAQEFDHLICLN